MSFGTILFDLDHTLLDSDTSLDQAYLAAATTAAIDEPASHRTMFEEINDELWRAVERAEISPNDVRIRRFETLLGRLGRGDESPELAPRMAEAFVAGLIEHGELYPGVLELLADLGDRPVALVTNGIGAVQRGRLVRLGLADRFDVVAISGELGMSKPGRPIFDHVLADLGEPDRSDVVMVGDNWSSDIVGAQRAETAAVWFNHRRSPAPSDLDGVVEAFTIADVRRVVV